jgi:hypothetical protein
MGPSNARAAAARQGPSRTVTGTAVTPCQSGPSPGHDSKGHPRFRPVSPGATYAGGSRPGRPARAASYRPVPIVRGQSVDTRRANRPELGATAAVDHTILPHHVLSRSVRGDLGRAGTGPNTRPAGWAHRSVLTAEWPIVAWRDEGGPAACLRSRARWNRGGQVARDEYALLVIACGEGP